MIKPVKQAVLRAHSELIKRTGGVHGIRDEGLLDSALQLPFMTYYGYDPFPSVIIKAARLTYGLINNHAFIDGNKRIGILIMITFLEYNNIMVSTSNDELIELGLNIANKVCDIDDIVRWIKRHRI